MPLIEPQLTGIEIQTIIELIDSRFDIETSSEIAEKSKSFSNNTIYTANDLIEELSQKQLLLKEVHMVSDDTENANLGIWSKIEG